MGNQGSKIFQFTKKYQTPNTSNPNQFTFDYENFQNIRGYQLVILQCLESSPIKQLKQLINKKQNRPCEYVTQIEESCVEEERPICSETAFFGLSYSENAISLYQLMKYRRSEGTTFNENDVIYMLQCTLRGLRYFQQIQQKYEFLTISQIILNSELKFKLIDTFLCKNNSSSIHYVKRTKNRYGLSWTNDDTALLKYQQNLKKHIQQIEERDTQMKHTNLLCLGLIALSMIDFNFAIENLFIKKGNKIEFKQQLLRRKLLNIDSSQLSQKIWLLTSQYPLERMQIYKSMNAKFDQKQYPRELLLKKTTFLKDMHIITAKKQKYIQNNISGALSLASTKQLRYSYARQNSQHLLNKARSTNQIKIKNAEPVISQSIAFNQKSTTHTALQNIQPSHLMISKPVSFVRQHPIIFKNNKVDQLRPICQLKLQSQSQIFLQQNLTNSATLIEQNKINQSVRKLKTQISEQTRKSNLKTNSDAKSQYKEQSYQQAVNFSYFNKVVPEILQLNDKEGQDNINQGDTLQKLLYREEQSIVLAEQDSNSNSGEAVKVDLSQFCYLNNNHYLLQNDASPEWSPINFKQDIKELINLKQQISNHVIKEESLQHSISANSQNNLSFTIEEYSSGNIYQGYKKNGMREGYGKMFYQTGQIYDGDWKFDKMTGFGKLFIAQDCLCYEGYWKNDKFHGKGKLYNQNPAVITRQRKSIDLSEVEDGWITYEGQFVEDKKTGKGRLTLQNGQYFQGTFLNDKLEGEGIFRSPSGKIIKGIWEHSILADLL